MRYHWQLKGALELDCPLFTLRPVLSPQQEGEVPKGLQFLHLNIEKHLSKHIFSRQGYKGKKYIIIIIIIIIIRIQAESRQSTILSLCFYNGEPSDQLLSGVTEAYANVPFPVRKQTFSLNDSVLPLHQQEPNLYMLDLV